MVPFAVGSWPTTSSRLTLPFSIRLFYGFLRDKWPTSSTTYNISFDGEGEFHSIGGDENLITHILTNLLSNAIKYSPERGLISFRLYQDQGDAVFEVADEGPGIPEPEREKVFEAFYKGVDPPVAAVKGSGLGLSIVKEYVTLHRGRIEILEGPGAHFRIRLPRRQREVEAAA